MPGGKQHVIERLDVKVCLHSILHKRFFGLLDADAQIVGNRQRFGSRVGAGLAEWIGPEELVARFVQLHSREERMSAIEILDHAGKSVTFISVEGPVITALEVIDTGFAGLPTRGRAKDQPWPRHVDERLTVIVPGGVKRADGLMLLPVANKVPDVHKRALEVRPNHAPVPCSGCNDYAQAGTGVRGNDVFVAGLGVVVPGHGDHVFGENGEQLGIFDRDISPEHELLVIGPHDLENFLEVFEINAAKTLLGSKSLRLAEAKFESLVRSDVKKRTGKQGNDLSVNLANEIVSFGIGRREHVPMGRFSEIGIDFVLQKLMKMPKRLLLGQEGYVVLAGVFDKFSYLGGRERCFLGCDFFRRNQRLGLEVENVFHVESDQVDLVLGQGADLHLQIIKRRDGAAADVIAHTPPFHTGPIADDQSRDGERLSCAAFRAQQLAKGLHAVEQALRGATSNEHSGVGHADYVALVVEVVADFYSLRFEIGAQAAISQ